MPQDKNEWLLQDTRSYAGNDMVFWKRGGRGYTTNIDEAHVYTREEAYRQHCVRDTDLPWPRAYLVAKSRPTVDMQSVKRVDALFSTTREG